ncbi:hypothetical protein B8V81_4315 [Paenibacillus pasadenensis]|uniref:Uncharacterized protein n=1 Tax=Paenibacillus pasadenensis TaxID=217090 RepID=A0A2N5N6A3_9BACL|nr:hypothetical protein [Paenibacillus pasadenensis]PLT45884.1 hypothetical protein B8V81_4315 [Paenibacillus pasadenensis]
MLALLRRTKSHLLIAAACLLGTSLGGGIAGAEDTAGSYNYSFWGDTVSAPAAYQATELLGGDDLGAGALKEPSDLHVTDDGEIYLLDSGNNRVLVLGPGFKLDRVIDSFERDGKRETFSNPQGLFVTDDKELVVADTGHKRVVRLDREGGLRQVVENPTSEFLAEGFSFSPVRVVVDKAQRMYVMAAGVFDGFMEFSSSGDFTSFIGANRVYFNPMDHLWKMLSTKAQRSQMVMFTPTEYTNLDIDEEGFLYATNGQATDSVRKLNAQGTDILRREGYFAPEGDIYYTIEDGPARLVDIDVGDSEMYSILDASRGRIFTYNGDGHFMYVFGGIGNQLGEFKNPTAVDRLGEDFLVLDKALGELTVFRTTEYGRTLNEAVRSYYRGDEEQAYEKYRQTIQMNANLEFAYSGIGKALLRQGDYRESMAYFKQSMDQEGYSKSFLLYRKQVLRSHFATIMSVVLALAAGYAIFRKYRKAKGGGKVAAMES